LICKRLDYCLFDTNFEQCYNLVVSLIEANNEGGKKMGKNKAKVLFSTGSKAIKKEQEHQKKVQESIKKGLWRFYIKNDQEEADISFLTATPVNFHEHTIKTIRNGKEYYDSIPCTGDDKYCEEGDKPSFKSAWLIIDHREYEYTDKKTGKKKKGHDQIRPYVVGSRVASQIDRLNQKYGLIGIGWTVTRLGKDSNTTYMFDRGDEEEYDEEEIENLLPEALREEYDGTEESLIELLKHQIEMQIEDSSDDDSDEEDEDEDNSAIVDMDEDEEEIEDDDEEEEPVHHHKHSSSHKLHSSKSSHRSVKSLLKHKHHK